MTELTSTINRLRTTFDSGVTRSRAWRAAQLDALANFLQEQQQEILRALNSDIGKGTFEAYIAEIAVVVADIENTRKNLSKWMKPEKVSMPMLAGIGCKTKIVHEPLGVALIIGAWNYPIMLTLGPLVGAIAAGNAAVIKPSELAPQSAQLLQDGVAKYLDNDAFAVVQGGIPETTELLDQKWDLIFFTGSTMVGQIVMEAAAKKLTPVVLELGGKSPAVVCDDANLDVAITRVTWGKYFNAGQTCIGVDYALVHESLYDDFIEGVTSKIKQFYGELPKGSPDLSRIVNKANLDRLATLIDGQTVATGGQIDPETLYFAPTVLRDVDPQSPVMQEEIFGPILPVIPFSTLDDVIDMINARDKPLAMYVFSEDKATQNRLIGATSSGGACINDVLTHITVGNAPFGGVGGSGIGSYHGYAGFLAFTHRRTVLSRSTAMDPNLRYPPYTDMKTKIATVLI